MNIKQQQGKAEHLLHSIIVRTTFTTLESEGISDRELAERLAEEVIQRIGQGKRAIRVLPGMENLVPQSGWSETHIPSNAEIERTVKALLVEVGHDKAIKNGSKPEKLAPVISPVGREYRDKEATAVKPTTTRLTPNAMRVLEKRYLEKDAKGQVIETAEEMFHRVARCVASAELIFNRDADAKAWEEEFYRAMAELEFLPNSPTLMNAGRKLGQLSACFVLPIEDSMESIFEGVKNTALIHQSGGGTGFSFSRLRPENDKVGSTGGVASGPVSFIRTFDTATDVIKQGGMRRGANMAILNINHPDILKFISAKEDPHAFTNFNFSVAVTEEFMKAVEKGADYNLINPRSKQTVATLNAKEVFDKIVDMAWKSGDPGIIFLDRINQDNPTPMLGAIESTNPCGEQPLLPYESCNLGSINLSRMLRQKEDILEIDYPKLANTVRMAVRFLDNVIEVNKFPLPQIEKMTKATRKIGLGVMGLADVLLRLGIPYDSEEALQVAQEIMRFISEEAVTASTELARERGAFPAFKGSIYDKPGRPGIRNATQTTVAPTGSLSIIAGCSSGIEPLFALCYTRTILGGEQFVEVNPFFEETARREGFWSEELMKELALKGSVRGIEGVPEWVQKVFVTSHDITPEWHVRMQAAIQKFTDNAVSKTVNFPHDATTEDIADVFLLAYRENCKGVTVYRDGSKEQQVLTISKARKPDSQGIIPRKRGAITTGFTRRVSTGCGNIYVTVNSDEKGICEVFSSLGKAGGCASAQLEAISRLISLALRSGLEPESIVHELRGIRCPSIAWEDGHAVLSCPDAIGGVLEGHLNGEHQNQLDQSTPQGNIGGQCPECGNMLVYQEGCQHCPSCGYTKCG